MLFQKVSSNLTSFSFAFLLGVKIHHLFWKSSENPASGPLSSVPAIGCGLIGSSLARAIKKNGLSNQIVSSNRSDSVNKKVIELKIVDDSNSDTKKMADGSDLIIIATPLSSYESVILK